jgi:riboflavin synthase
MFSGIVTAVGTVRAVRSTASGRTLSIAAPYRGVKLGESISVDGVCLTVVRRARGVFSVQVVTATLSRTKLGSYRRFRRVNLERALRYGARVGGHLVSGHVDGVGRVVRRLPRADSVWLDVAVPPLVRRASILHGSIAVEGVSLTVNALPRRGVVQVSLIPYTLKHTTLGVVRVGALVHLEADLLARLVHQVVGQRVRSGTGKE